ncbi:MAG TPA: tetratricopeptide repeat protein [Candidatus Cryosericum sp.]|nr:tetratricopeptide repeat protein [Candidatus Cryosericum sp.]
MNRKSLVLAALAALVLAESVYFGRACLAGFARLRGERAFYRNDLQASWKAYQTALRLGGPRGVLETDLMEVLLFGLDLREAGVKRDLALDEEASTPELRRLIARAIRRIPYRATYWSMAGDLFLRQARLDRLDTPLDLSAVSEEPLENLAKEDWWGIAALEKAASLEPGNYLYEDLLAEQLLDYGAEEEAARACRRAVTSYPRLDGHTYLTRSNLPPVVVRAAVEGFNEALLGESQVARAAMEMDAGRLLVRHGESALAVPFLERAARASPDLYDARMQLALALSSLGRFREAIPHYLKAAERLPDEAPTYFYLGQAQMQVGEREAGIESFRKARTLGNGAPTYFHALGTALEEDGLLREAERQFTAAAYQNPTDVSAWSALLAFHLRRGDRNAAVRDCDKLLNLKTADDQAREQCAAVGR